MIVSEEEKIGTEPIAFEIVWRNPLALVPAQLRDKEVSDRHKDGQNRPERFSRRVS